MFATEIHEEHLVNRGSEIKNHNGSTSTSSSPYLSHGLAEEVVKNELNAGASRQLILIATSSIFVA
jgi:hypothetical protein